MTSDFASEVAKYSTLKVAQNHKIAQNNVQAYCLAPLVMQLVSYYFEVLQSARTYVCLSVHSHLKNHMSEPRKFCAHVNCGRDSVLL